MSYLLDEALEQGAWGYSTGLEYAAERGADEDELVAMCEVCGRRHALYATHTRRRDDGADDAVAEALRTAARSGVRLQVSHLVPRNGIESARRCLELVERAAAGGHGRRVRHAHAALRDHLSAHGAAALGARGSVAAAGDPRRARSSGDAMQRLREHPQRRRRLEPDRAAGQRRVARLRPPRRRRDRRRARAGAARRRLRPAARRAPTTPVG